jgi:hypothetical protein
VQLTTLALAGTINLNGAAPLPGTEHLHVLPVDEDQVMEWVEDGSLERRRVLLTDTKGLSLSLSLTLSRSLAPRILSTLKMERETFKFPKLEFSTADFRS